MVKPEKWPIFNKIMGCYTIYFIIAVSLTSVNLDLLTELEHFDNIIDDMNDTAVPPVQGTTDKLFNSQKLRNLKLRKLKSTIKRSFPKFIKN